MSRTIDNKWRMVMEDLPYRQLPYSKKNWGNPNHSLCSYQGKLKPSIAYHLVQTFVPSGGSVLDPFSGVGTIPFEAALNGKRSFGLDISPLAYYVSSAKVQRVSQERTLEYIQQLNDFIHDYRVPDEYIELNGNFGYNKTLNDYYERNTFIEILAARVFFQNNPPNMPEHFLVISCLLHILHGNRPYALSRKSHPIIPYAPMGQFEYKSLIEKTFEKVNKALNAEIPDGFVDGRIFMRDSTLEWPDEICDLDAIITSPPFFDSTRFYIANWIRLWFTGWNEDAFSEEPKRYVDERQKHGFDVYDSVFEQARNRLKTHGYFVMHLGKSKKCNMGEELQKRCRKWFPHAKLYNENVDNCEKFGIKDLGTVSEHQYLIMH